MEISKDPPLLCFGGLLCSLGRDKSLCQFQHSSFKTVGRDSCDGHERFYYSMIPNRISKHPHFALLTHELRFEYLLIFAY